jgi:hypothetical protein
LHRIDKLKALPGISENHASAIIHYLQYLECVTIDIAYLRRQINYIDDMDLFFNRKDQINEFCIGARHGELTTDIELLLQNSQQYDRCNIVGALHLIIEYPAEPSNEEAHRFSRLLESLGLTSTQSLRAISSEDQFCFIEDADLKRAIQYMSTIDLET